MDELTHLGYSILSDEDIAILARLVESGDLRKGRRLLLPAIKEEDYEEEDMLSVHTPARDSRR